MAYATREDTHEDAVPLDAIDRRRGPLVHEVCLPTALEELDSFTERRHVSPTRRAISSRWLEGVPRSCDEDFARLKKRCASWSQVKPMPPWIWIVSPAQRRNASEQNALAILAATARSSSPAPEAATRAALRLAERAHSTSTEHVGALVLDRLERSDWAVELGADLGVLDRHLEAARRAADLLGRERGARAMEDALDGTPSRRRARRAFGGHADVAESHVGEPAGHVDRPDRLPLEAARTRRGRRRGRSLLRLPSLPRARRRRHDRPCARPRTYRFVPRRTSPPVDFTATVATSLASQAAPRSVIASVAVVARSAIGPRSSARCPRRPTQNRARAEAHRREERRARARPSHLLEDGRRAPRPRPRATVRLRDCERGPAELRRHLRPDRPIPPALRRHRLAHLHGRGCTPKNRFAAARRALCCSAFSLVMGLVRVGLRD